MSALGLHIRGTEFRVACLYRLGMPVYPSDGPCVACGQHSDRQGNHAISCGNQGERIARHNHLRDAIYATAAASHLAPTKEDNAILPNSANRPADVMVTNFMGGLHAAVDVTCRLPLLIGLPWSLAMPWTSGTNRNGLNMGKHAWLRECDSVPWSLKPMARCLSKEPTFLNAWQLHFLEQKGENRERLSDISSVI